MVTSSVRHTIEKLMEERQEAIIVKDLLAYFSRNRKAVETSSELAAHINHSRGEVHPILEVLAKIGILAKKSTGQGEYYLYRPDQEVRVQLQQHLRALPTKERKLRTATERFRKTWGKRY